MFMFPFLHFNSSAASDDSNESAMLLTLVLAIGVPIFVLSIVIIAAVIYIRHKRKLDTSIDISYVERDPYVSFFS
jgi:hypothetical protein